jgi:hypothetical protein
MRSRAPLLFIIATTGCMNEYHPEFHPVTTTTFVQNVSAPTTLIGGLIPETSSDASNLTIDLPPKYDMPPSTPVLPPEARREIQPKNTVIASSETPARPNVSVDAPQAPGTYLGPNVEIGPGVTFGGNVYIQGDLIIGGTRQHPVLMTR